MGIAFVSNLAIEKSLALGLVKAIAIKELKLNGTSTVFTGRKGLSPAYSPSL